jgi:hypothetical protein
MRRCVVGLGLLLLAGLVLLSVLVSGDEPTAGQASSPQSADLKAVVAAPLPRARQYPATYVFSTAPDLTAQVVPTALPVYQVVRTRPTRDMICDLAERAGIPVSADRYALLPESKPDRPYYGATVGQLTETSLGELDVDLFDSGSYMLTFRNRRPEPADEAPSDDAARAAADAFLAHSGLLPEGCTFTLLGEGQSTDSTSDQGQSYQKRVNSKIVIYERHLNGIPSGSLQVEVNGKGEIFAVRRNMRNLVSIGEYPLISVAEAVDALRQGRAAVAGPFKPGEPILAMVDNARIVYYQGPSLLSLDTVQPVYELGGPVQGYSNRFLAYVHALRPEHLIQLEPAPLPGKP